MNTEPLQSDQSGDRPIEDGGLREAQSPSVSSPKIVQIIVKDNGAFIDFGRTPLSPFEKKLALAIAKMDSSSSRKEQPRRNSYKIDIPATMGCAEVHFVNEDLVSLNSTLQEVRTIGLSATKDLAVYRATTLLDGDKKIVEIPALKKANPKTPLFVDEDPRTVVEANTQIEEQLSCLLKERVTKTEFTNRLLAVAEIAKNNEENKEVLVLCNFLQAMVDPQRTVAVPIRQSVSAFLVEVSDSEFKEAAQYARHLIRNFSAKYSDQKLEAIMNRLATSQSVEANRAGLKRLFDYLQRRLLTLRQESEEIMNTSISEFERSITQARSYNVFSSSPQDLIRGFQVIEGKLQQLKSRTESK